MNKQQAKDMQAKLCPHPEDQCPNILRTGKCNLQHGSFLPKYRPKGAAQIEPDATTAGIEAAQVIQYQNKKESKEGKRQKGGAGDILRHKPQKPKYVKKEDKSGVSSSDNWELGSRIEHQDSLHEAVDVVDINQPQDINHKSKGQRQLYQKVHNKYQFDLESRPKSTKAVTFATKEPPTDYENLHSQRAYPKDYKVKQPPQLKSLMKTPYQKVQKPGYSAKQLNQLISMPIEAMKCDLHKHNFKSLLDGTNVDAELSPLVLNVIKLLIADNTEAMLLSQFLESNFVKELRIFIEQEQAKPVRSVLEYEDRHDFLKLAIEVFSHLLDLFPSKRDVIPAISLCFSTEFLQTSEYIKSKAPHEIEQMLKSPHKLKEQSERFKNSFMESLRRQAAEEKKKKEEKEKVKVYQVKDESFKIMPLEDFTMVDPFPGERELTMNNSNHVRRMPEMGDLVNQSNYLDLLFRLLYEDAVTDLRGGVQMMKILGRKQKEGAQLTRKQILAKAREASIKLHEEVKIQGVEAVDGVACVAFRIQTNKNRFVDWKISKKLLPGSLVLLSSDNFTSIFVGIIKQRDAVIMNKTHKKYGFVPINIEVVKFINIASPPESVLEITERYSTFTFVMIESSAYFESYIHVLRSLQQMNAWLSIPFSPNIISGRSIISPPKYAQHQSALRLNSIQSFIENLSLDHSQCAAMQKALTSELALIQGPPGTGKTYIGVQIVKYLLQFRHYWSAEGPILLVTYTNHALNQFITHVAHYTDKIVRVGGKVEDEYLKRFGLRELLFQRGIKYKYGKLRKVIEEAKRDIRDQQTEYDTYQQGYLHTHLAEQLQTIGQYNRGDPDLYLLVNGIFQTLKQAFPPYLQSVLRKFKKQRDFNVFVEVQIDKLREKTGNNILFIFWLGIIDLESYIKSVFEHEYQRASMAEKKESKEKADEELEENDQDFLDERDKDYLREEEKFNFNDSLEVMYNTIQDNFYHKTCCKQLLGKAETFSEAISFINDYQWVNQEQIDKAIQQATSKDTFTKLPVKHRWALNNYILDDLKTKSSAKMEALVDLYKGAQADIEKLDQDTAQTIFKTTDIVAMTTTGRSKYSEYFKKVTFPIVIVEEAAEVFEAHIITALSQSTQHLILIGDHLQLRPNPAVYDLSFNYNLSLSMFERLINNKIPHSTLAQQRRMRPEISKMMNLIYPDLQNHSSVLRYPQIKGVSSSLYFYDHTFKESTNDAMMSKVNKDEAEIVVRFAVYLLQNRYAPDKITILTLYAGQLLHIKQLMRSYKIIPEVLKYIRVINVDNYQGEENDIILLSLVRSNPESKIGFLKISNRVCVALSRARMGLFIFGNSKCLLGSKLQLWADVVSYLKENAFFGESLKFQCANHKIATEVKTLKDFHKIPEGGCTKPCETRLVCGHCCQSLCHPFEQTLSDPTGHKRKTCSKPCARPQLCGHECSYKCDECKKGHLPCRSKINRLMPACNHTITIECRQNIPELQCSAQCDKILACGHRCKQKCYQDCTQKPCKVDVEKQLPCGHTLELACHQDPLTTFCYKTCGHYLQCGHQCIGKCGDCSTNGHHEVCKEKCNKTLICNHKCGGTCSQSCAPCKAKCDTKCIHSECKAKCGECCEKCKEPCDNRCEHTACTNLCRETCNRAPCNEKCAKMLECGHPCIGLCGERCPNLCRECKPADQSFKPFFLGQETDPEAAFVELDCGHIFEVKGLDNHMNKEQTIVRFKECPRCKQPIKKCKRYTQQINQTLNDINKIRGIINENNTNVSKKFTEVKNYLKRAPGVKENQSELEKSISGLNKMLSQKLQIFKKLRSVKDLNTLIEDCEYEFELRKISQLNDKMSDRESFQRDVQRSNSLLAQWVDDATFNRLIETDHRDQVLQLKRKLQSLYPYDLSLDTFKIEKIPIVFEGNDWHKCLNMHYYTPDKGSIALLDEINLECPQCASHNAGGGAGQEL